ncbi:MAG TPA: anthranilate synthase component I family protein [Ginsengibacter sp.]|nr:anthranilate synthase component I family protein [Ginsengibacter sp.]
MLNFIKKFSIFCFLDNNEYNFHKSYECIAGVGMLRSLVSNSNNSLKDFDRIKRNSDDWIFAHVAYDVKNEIENLHSANPDGIGFPNFVFFVPEIVFILSGNEIKIGVHSSLNAQEIFEEIISSEAVRNIDYPSPLLKPRFTKMEYIETVEKLQRHILRGDCYEINFCQEFYADGIIIDPLSVYRKLSKLSSNPFSAFYKYQDKYLVCASPERFLKKTGDTIIAQPIKGTAKRIMKDSKADQQRKDDLLSSDKERSENIMIVDLVRNDLAKICTQGSVVVNEFLAIYSFPQVHQMISTVTGNLKEDISFADIFYAAFPMGSMTGAPKKRVMELIEKYERTSRGLFSGTVGYITPEGDFDFNVVIRSIIYNKSNSYLSIQAGSAITAKSEPEHEYEECLLKISAMKKALE